MGLKGTLNRFFGWQNNSDKYIGKLRSLGAKVGENVVIFNPSDTHIDITGAHLLTIGNDVQMTGPITILTHDYSWSVLKRKYGEVLGNQKPITIGNNCFIGWGATILCGTTIGDDCVIGAHSVVSGNVLQRGVYAGSPVKRICSIDDYYNKRKSSQLDEAVVYVKMFKERYGRNPKPSEVREYFPLYTSSKDTELLAEYDGQLSLMRNREETIKGLKPMFESFEKFIEYCFERREGVGQ